MNHCGKEAEITAQHFLQSQGLVILQNNYSWRSGEIDIIAKDQQTIVFIEVRLRRHRNFGQAAESVTHSKQNKIIKTALRYLQENKLVEKYPCRFDIVALGLGTEPVWIQDAFQAH